jgi:hypothetical protein
MLVPIITSPHPFLKKILTNAIPSHLLAERYRMLKGQNKITKVIITKIKGHISDGMAGANISVKSMYIT